MERPVKFFAGRSTKKLASQIANAFGAVLNENKIKSSKRLFFTATPRVLTQNIKTNVDNITANITFLLSIYFFPFLRSGAGSKPLPPPRNLTG